MIKNIGLCAIASFLLLACSSENFNEQGYISGFYGGVFADEPYSALVGEEILAKGGNAADAMVAMAFAQSVAKPSSFSLGAMGACVVHNPQSAISENLQFLPNLSMQGSSRQNDTKILPPAMPRAMAALHARYGRLPIRLLLAPAENLARNGHRAARAFTKEQAASSMQVQGKFIQEGEEWQQNELATTLAQLRIQGIGALYQGRLANQLTNGLKAQGYDLSQQALQAFSPKWTPTLSYKMGDYEWLTVRPPFIGGIIHAQTLSQLMRDDYEGLSNGTELLNKRLHQALAASAEWKDIEHTQYARHQALLSNAQLDKIFSNPHDASISNYSKMGANGLIAADRTGFAVVCEFSMLRPFGGGISQNGIFMVSAPKTQTEIHNATMIAPQILIDEDTKKFHYAAVSGNPNLNPLLILNSEIWLKARTDIIAIMDHLPSQSMPEIAGKPAFLHCLSGIPESEIDKRLCTLAKHPSSHGLILQAGLLE